MEHSKVISRAKALRGEGLSYRRIAKQMNREGFKAASGKALTDNSVYYYANHPGEEKKPPKLGITLLMERVWQSELKQETKRKIADLILNDLVS
jgi:hypothetical protein